MVSDVSAEVKGEESALVAVVAFVVSDVSAEVKGEESALAAVVAFDAYDDAATGS